MPKVIINLGVSHSLVGVTLGRLRGGVTSILMKDETQRAVRARVVRQRIQSILGTLVSQTPARVPMQAP